MCLNKTLSEIKLEISEIAEFSNMVYTEIENSETSEILSRLVVFLLEVVRNFQDFLVFDFSPYTKIENLENSEIFPRLFAGGSWKFPMFTSFRFWPLYKNQKLFSRLVVVLLNFIFIYLFNLSVKLTGIRKFSRCLQNRKGKATV